jgi:hypothetical protein
MEEVDESLPEEGTSLKIKARSSEAAPVPYPLSLYAFNGKGKCSASQKIVSKDDRIELVLPAGNYQIVAIAGYSDAYIDDLSYLKYVPDLKYLEFFVGSVSDISFLQYTPNLIDLNISYNPISDVTYLLNLPKIERLWCEHTNLTVEDYELLKQTYPDAKIVYYGEGSVDQGWRTHDRYFAMIDMYHNNYVHELFKD